jgi:DNA-binding IclR family transcriptional regulator
MTTNASFSTKAVKSVTGAAAVLRYLAAASAPPGVNAIARGAGLSPSSCFNILKTLVAEELASFDVDTKTYGLGLGLVRLARRALASTGTIATIRPLLDQFARGGLATGVWEVASQGRLVLAAFLESDAATRIHMSIGHRLPLMAGAMGRCIAAAGQLPSNEIRRRFAEVRWECRPDFATYVEQVERAAARGWAIDEDCFIRGITTVAAPIKNGDQVRFCISNSLFSGQSSEAEMERLGAATTDAARKASSLLFGG